MRPVSLDGFVLQLKNVSIPTGSETEAVTFAMTFSQEAGHLWGAGATGFIIRIGSEEGKVSLYVKKADDLDDIRQYVTKYEILNATLRTYTNGMKAYRDEGKLIGMFQDNGRNAIRLEVYASNEYTAPRTEDNPAWPGLLLEQYLAGNNYISLDNFSSITYSMDVRINFAENKMGSNYNPNLHCAQTTAYLTVQNLNQSSPDYGKYVWFGIPIFDSRFDFSPANKSLDVLTGAYIFSMGGEDFLTKHYNGVNPRSGRWAHLEVDLIPYINEAIKYARNQGVWKSTSISDLMFGGFNIGWEVPGTFDCSMDIKNISLRGKFKS